LRETNVKCSGLKTIYLDFVKEVEHQDFSEVGKAKNRKVICDILKYESLMN